MSKFNELITLDNLFVLCLSAYLLYMQELRTDCKISTTRSKYRILVLLYIPYHDACFSFVPLQPTLNAPQVPDHVKFLVVSGSFGCEVIAVEFFFTVECFVVLICSFRA